MFRYFYTSSVIYGVASDRLAEVIDADGSEVHADVYVGCPVTALRSDCFNPAEQPIALDEAVHMPNGTYRLCMCYSPGFLLTDVIIAVEVVETKSIRPSMRPRMSTFPDAPHSRAPRSSREGV